METIPYKGFTIKIMQDEFPAFETPRDYGVISDMIYFGPYIIGDRHDYNHRDYSGWEEMRAQIEKDYNTDIILPLYLYDHSGLSISTSPFHCPWDSGQVGWVVVNREKMRGAIGWKNITINREDELYSRLKEEVKYYDTYLTEGYWGFEVMDDAGRIVSCLFGCLGEEDAVLCAKEEINSLTN